MMEPAGLAMQKSRTGMLALLLLLLCGDVEVNPGPPGRREPKPDPKKIMEEKVNSHDEKIAALEKLVQEQAARLEEMTGKQVELADELTATKVELGKAGEENKVLEERVTELQVKLVEADKAQVELTGHIDQIQVKLVESGQSQVDLSTHVHDVVEVKLVEANEAQVVLVNHVHELEVQLVDSHNQLLAVKEDQKALQVNLLPLLPPPLLFFPAPPFHDLTSFFSRQNDDLTFKRTNSQTV